MRFPLPPTDSPVIDKNGMMTHEWAQYHANLHLQNKTNLSDDGFWIPKVTPEQITELEKQYLDPENTDVNPKYNQAQHVYNTQTNKHMLNENGTFKTIVTS